MKNNSIEIRRISQPFDPAIWISKKYRLPIARANIIAELAGFNRHQSDDFNYLMYRLSNREAR